MNVPHGHSEQGAARHRLLTSALEAFSEEGFEAAEASAIASRAGLDRLPDSLPDKESLLRAVIDRFLTVRFVAAEANETLEVPPGVFLPRVARAILAFFAQPEVQAAQRLCTAESPTLARLGIGVVRDRSENVFQLLEGYFRLQIAKRAVADIDPGLAARAFLGLVWAHVESRYFQTYLTPEDLPDEDFIRKVLPLLLNGLLERR